MRRLRQIHRPTIRGQPMPLGQGQAWRLVLQDGFDGLANSPPDLSKWNYWLPDDKRRDAWNRTANTYLDGASNLVIQTVPGDVGDTGVGAGGITSVAAFGPESYFEFSVRSPDPGWLAIWLQTRGGMNGLNTPPDPADGAEYDMAEKFDGGSVSSNVHWGGYDANHQALGLQAYGVTESSFYTIGAWWSLTANSFRFFLNGVLARTFTTLVSTRTDEEIRLTHEYELAMGTVPVGGWKTYIGSAMAWVPT
mgnify:CR=1 FL=1